MCFAKADGSWLKKVPETDRARVNPYAGDPNASRPEQISFATTARNATAKMHKAKARGHL